MAKAYNKNIGYSAYKMRRIIDLIRSKSVIYVWIKGFIFSFRVQDKKRLEPITFSPSKISGGVRPSWYRVIACPQYSSKSLRNRYKSGFSQEVSANQSSTLSNSDKTRSAATAEANPPDRLTKWSIIGAFLEKAVS